MDTYNTGSGTKNSSKIRKKFDKYKSDVVDAFDIGYASGWDTSYLVPDCLFGKIHATLGFKRGLYDNFNCFDEGVYVGEVSPDVIKQLRKCN